MMAPQKSHEPHPDCPVIGPDGKIHEEYVPYRREADVKKETTAIMGLILAVAVQTGGFIWWAATLTANLQNVSDVIREMKLERYTRSDAIKDFDRVQDKLSEVDRRLNAIDGNNGKRFNGGK